MSRLQVIRRQQHLILVALGILLALPTFLAAQLKQPFGDRFPQLDSLATHGWWEKEPTKQQPMPLNVPRDEVVAFAVYTHHRRQLKMTAQFFPLMPDEVKEARLEFKQADGSWREVAKQPINELGWSSHFRVSDWDGSKECGLPGPAWRSRSF